VPGVGTVFNFIALENALSHYHRLICDSLSVSVIGEF
jgi:hypothetical protein